MSWDEFLKHKADGKDRETRRMRIQAWIKNASVLDSPTNTDECQSIINEALESFDRAVKKMREIKSNRKL